MSSRIIHAISNKVIPNRMCLILFAYKSHPRWDLIVAANRDEFYVRPTAPAGFWQDHSKVLAGRDLEAGGTWMGITLEGRFAAVTNYRNGLAVESVYPQSRGQLIAGFLSSGVSAGTYLGDLNGDDFAGYNVLVDDGVRLYYGSNRGPSARRLEAGIYGLSNHLLDSDWPKVSTGKQALDSALTTALSSEPDTDELFDILADEQIAADPELPDTGIPLEWERMLSAKKIRSDSYGTRASTLVLRSAEEILFYEREFDAKGSALPTRRFLIKK